MPSSNVPFPTHDFKWVFRFHAYSIIAMLSRSNNSNNNNNNNDLKRLKQELAALLAQDAKADKLRSLPLYSCRITGWKFVCSKCYDKAYNNNMLLQRH
jgi:hypothetical protein